MPVPAGHPSGKCTLCGHADRVRIELQLAAGGASLNALARKYGISRHVLGRHWENHVSEARRAALVLGPVKQFSPAAQVSEEAESVIDHFRAVRAGLYRLYDAALEAGDRNGGALVAGRLLTCLDSMARLTGQLASSPLIQNNVQNNFYLLPEFAAFEADLIRVLSRFPDARAAVLQEFERLETTPVQRPALEHQHHAAA